MLLLLMMPGARLAVAAADASTGTGGGTAWRWLSPELRRLEAERAVLAGELAGLPAAPPPQITQRLGWHSDYSNSRDTVEWIELNLGGPQRLDSVVLVAPPPGGGSTEPGYGFPLRFRIELLGEDDETQRTLLADFTGEDFPNPGLLPVVIPAGGRTAHKVRVTATRLFREDQRYLFALGEVMLFQGEKNLSVQVEAVGPAHVHASSSQGTRPDWGRINVVDGHTVLGPPLGPAPSPTLGYRNRPSSESQGKLTPWVEVDLGAMLPVEEVRLFPTHPPQFAHSHGYGFPLRYQMELRAEGAAFPVVFAAPQSGSYSATPGDNMVTVITPQARARFVRLQVLEPHVSNGSVVLAMAEMQVWSGGKNVAAGRAVVAPSSTEEKGWSKAALVDGYASGAVIVNEPGWLSGLSRRREVGQGILALDARRQALADSFKNWAWGLAAGLVAVALAGLLVAYGRQRRARRKELEELRQRISQDLHDEIGSSLGSIMLITEDAMAVTREAELRHDLIEIRDTARQTMDSMRDIVRLAQSGSYGGDDLTAHLREIAARMLRGMPHTLEAEGVGPVPMDQRRDLVLLFKELLHNLVRHAQARSAQIGLRQNADSLELSVRDDGCGFEPEHVKSGGMGLTNLQRRAGKHGGSVEIRSSPGQGTFIRIRLPRHA